MIRVCILVNFLFRCGQFPVDDLGFTQTCPELLDELGCCHPTSVDFEGLLPPTTMMQCFCTGGSVAGNHYLLLRLPLLADWAVEQSGAPCRLFPMPGHLVSLRAVSSAWNVLSTLSLRSPENDDIYWCRQMRWRQIWGLGSRTLSSLGVA